MRLVDLQKELRETLLESRAPLNALRLAELLLAQPYVTASWVERTLGVTNPTAQKAIRTLEGQGILIEVTGQPRYRLYYAPRLFDAVYGDTPAAD